MNCIAKCAALQEQAASPAKICGHKAGDIKKESGLPSRKNRLKKTCFDQKQQNMG